MEEKYLPIGNMIKNVLLQQERTVAWFARSICCSRPNVYKIFEKDNIDINLLILISKALNHDFFMDISELIKDDINEVDDNRPVRTE